MLDNRRVVVRLGGNFNMGNYNNMEIKIEVEDYVRDDLDEGNMAKAIDRVYALVDKKLYEKLEEARSSE